MRWLVKFLPWKKRFLITFALLPSFFKKVGWVPRFSNLVFEACSSPPQSFLTNLGMKGVTRVRMSSKAGAVPLFGCPSHYRGERGALLLSRELVSDCDTFIDIGAHRGYFVYYMRAFRREVPIYFFEPHPILYQEIIMEFRSGCRE